MFDPFVYVVKCQTLHIEAVERMNLKERCLLIFGLTVFFLPILFTGLHYDDRELSVEYHQRPDSIGSAIDNTATNIERWAALGRFAPVSNFLYSSIFQFTKYDNPLSYHLIQLVLVILSCYLFFRLFVHENVFGGLLLLLASANFYSYYHDPYFAYQLLLPILSLTIFGAYWLFEKYLDTGKIVYAFGFSMLFILSLLTYEIAYSLIFVFFVRLVLRAKSNKAAWGVLASLLSLSVAMQLVVRSYSAGSEKTYHGLEFGLSLYGVIRTFIMQAFSCMPFARVFGQFIDRIASDGNLLEGVLVWGSFFAIVLTGVWAVFRFFNRKSEASSNFLIGWIFWFGPAAMIAVSAKYQVELQWDRGYLPRYFQAFGFVLMAISAFKLLSGLKVKLVGGILFVATVFVFLLNLRSVDQLNNRYSQAVLMFHLVEQRSLSLASTESVKLHASTQALYSTKNLECLGEGIEVSETKRPSEGDWVVCTSSEYFNKKWLFSGYYRGGQIEQAKLYLREKDDESGLTEGLDPVWGNWYCLELPDWEASFDDLSESVGDIVGFK